VGDNRLRYVPSTARRAIIAGTGCKKLRYKKKNENREIKRIKE